MVNFEEVEKSIQNARLVMNAYLRGATQYSLDGMLNITLKKGVKFYFEDESGKHKLIKDIRLIGRRGCYVVSYNGGDVIELTDLSSNELFVLCSVVDSFIKDKLAQIEPEEVEYEEIY